MPKLRKGELKFYKGMNPTELSHYLKDFPMNEIYVVKFLEKHKYNWVRQEWHRGKTI